MADMRHAAAGNVLTLKMATSASHHSHTFTAQPAAVGMSSTDSLTVAATESQADGPARCSRCWTPVNATHSTTVRVTPIGYDDPKCHTLNTRDEGTSANPHVHSRGNPTGITHGGIFAR
ncbi:hypothetical protein JCM18237_18170 [Halorubrum luteum]